ncbi:DUF362 domain-containing protein [Halomarina ordinaria]|uniref:DUF362 domain-containing protein n=1 Tax=Halomarina ordinaria TaxID=3033939 RepID=A0ABD5UDF2_9EURY|nr:DUF362 domain-containing protein [Halomarina sp. PSRA2]
MSSSHAVGERLARESGSLAAGVESVLADAPLDGRVLLLPDCHYPYHPSTGLVTNPDVVAAAVEALDGEVVLCLPDSPWVEGERFATFLGYDDLADRLGVDVLDLSAAPTVERVVTVGDERSRVTVPEPLERESLLAVPTLRTDPDHGFVAGLGTTAFGALGADAADATTTDVVGAAAVCDPDYVLLDATYTYTGGPYRADLLLGSADAPTLDAAAARLVGEDPAEVPFLAPHGVEAPSVPGVDLDAVAAALPSRGETGGEPSPVMQTGYRIYSRVTGDLLPPHFMGGADE